MRSIFRLLLAAVFSVALLAGVRAYGQGGATGAISGLVLDTSGGAVTDAEIQVIDARTEALARRLTTNADGAFTAPLLPPATYYVVVNKSGFAQSKAEGIEVHVTETARVTISLKPGAVTEKVEISAQVTSVETTNATTGQSIDTSTVRELAPGHAELSATAHPVHWRAERTECLRPARSRQRSRHRQRPARRQQQLPDRRHQRHRLQRCPGHQRAACPTPTSSRNSRCKPRSTTPARAATAAATSTPFCAPALATFTATSTSTSATTCSTPTSSS